MKEKLGKIFEVKGVKGMRKLVKEIAVTATTGQHENELIGKANIPLNVREFKRVLKRFLMIFCLFYRRFRQVG